MIISNVNKKTHFYVGWLTAGLSALSLLMVVYSFTGYQPENLSGVLISDQQRGLVPWKTIREPAISSGATVPPDINVIIKIPEDVGRITRRTLFGHRGETVRYWGYCFPPLYNRSEALTRRGFPGTLFLSEAERAYREEQKRIQMWSRFSVYTNLDDDVLNENDTTRGMIRHQQEIFEGGMACYIMTDEPLPIGTDEDQDGVNIKMEKEKATDPSNPDTDADGILDGLEIFGLRTNPIKRDTDGDGIIDGIEDANRNGISEHNETDPTQWDTDQDGLCDGLCKVNKGREIRGEDKNLNGVVDPGETDPRLEDTDGDSILDEQEFFNCLLGVETEVTCEF